MSVHHPWQTGYVIIIDRRVVSNECPRSHTSSFRVTLACIRFSVPVNQDQVKYV